MKRVRNYNGGGPVKANGLMGWGAARSSPWRKVMAVLSNNLPPQPSFKTVLALFCRWHSFRTDEVCNSWSNLWPALKILSLQRNLLKFLDPNSNHSINPSSVVLHYANKNTGEHERLLMATSKTLIFMPSAGLAIDSIYLNKSRYGYQNKHTFKRQEIDLSVEWKALF